MHALLIGILVATASACVAGPADDDASEREPASSSTGPDRDDASTRTTGQVMRFTPARVPAARITVPTRLDAGPGHNDAVDAGPDNDAGAGGADPSDSEFERAIAYDCTETVMCNSPANNIPQCVVRVREALTAASPETRQVFLENVRRCRPHHACDYVDCATRTGR